MQAQVHPCWMMVIKLLTVNKAQAYHRGVPMARGRVRPMRKFLSHINLTLGIEGEAPEKKSPKEASQTAKKPVKKTSTTAKKPSTSTKSKPKGTATSTSKSSTSTSSKK